MESEIHTERRSLPSMVASLLWSLPSGVLTCCSAGGRGLYAIPYTLFPSRYTLPAGVYPREQLLWPAAGGSTQSTSVENVRQINLFLQNKPNFPHFSPKNEDFTKKQTQNKPNQSQFWANIKGGKAKQSQFKAILY
jgi:hypothetical protein